MEVTAHIDLFKRNKVIPENEPGAPIYYDKEKAIWHLNGSSPYGFIQIEATLDPELKTLAYSGSIDDRACSIQSSYHRIDDKVIVHGYHETYGDLYLEIIFIDELRIACLNGTFGGEVIGLEMENVVKELHWGYVSCCMLASMFGLG